MKASFYVVMASLFAAGLLGLINRHARPSPKPVKTYSIEGRTVSLDASNVVRGCRVGSGEWFKPRADGLCYVADEPK